MIRIPVPDSEQLKQRLTNFSSLTYITTGGFKVVFKGVDSSNHIEAVKAVYIPSERDGFEPEQTTQLEARARREIAALKLCTIPGIVHLGRLDPTLVSLSAGTFLVYSEEFLPGAPLSEKISRANNPAFPVLLNIFTFLIDVIDEMIRIEHLHRDIKPANIMVTGISERPYVVLDMGIAYKLQGTQLTQGPTPPGTLRYMAPELFLPDYKDIMDFRCDLYSAALCVYEFATGIQPFAPRPENEYATVYRIQHDKPTPLESIRPDLPKQFCRIIDRCIRKMPALRYANTNLLRNDLQEAQI